MNANSFQSGISAAVRTLWILAGLCLGSGVSQGDTLTWDGSSSTLWGTAANWVENAVPADGDTLLFPSSASNKATVNNIVGLDVYKIEIQGTGYSLSGNTIGLIESIRINTTYLTIADMYMDVELVADAQIRMMGYNNHLLFYGDVDLGAYDLRVGNYGLVRLYGVVSGSGSVVKFGTGTVSFNGSSGNTFSGSTTVEDGTLELDQASGNSIPFDLVIEDGATVLQNASYKIGDDVTIYGAGTYDMNGQTETIGDLVLYDGADFDSGTSTLTLAGDLITDGGISTLSGNLGLSSGSHDFNILYNGLLLWPGAHCWLNADVSGLGSINKIGPGKLRIAGNNTYTGETTVLGGDIMIESNTALGSSVAGTTVNTGSRIYLSAFSSGSSKNIVGEALSLGGDFYSYGVANSWSGSIELTDDVEIKVSFGSSLELTGNIGGSGGVTKDWGGTLIYSGSSANSYSGDTVVNQGTLLLNRPANAIYYGSLTIGNGTGTDDSVIVRLQNDFQIWDSVDITINSDGWLDCDAYADTVGAITLEGGHAGSSTGTLRLGGDVTVIASDSEALLDGNVEMGSGTRTFTVGDGSVGYDLRATASLSGNGLLKTGGGLMALQGANTFTGAATVNQGRLYVLNDDALGTTAGGTTVSASGFIQLVGADVGAEPLTLARTSSGTVLYGTGSSSWAGDIVLDEDAQMAASGTLVLSGSISGAGGITMSSGGTISLSGSGNNTFDGDVTVVAGTLLMGKTGQSIPHSLLIGGNGTGDPVATARQLATSEIFEDVTINASGVYDLNGYNEAVRDLYLNGGADVDTGTATLTVVGDVLVDLLGIIDANSTMAGKLALSGNTTLEVPQGSASSGNPSDLIIDAVVSGSGNISKTGNGELQLTAANTFSGPFSVDAGALRLDNDLGLGTTAGGVSVNGSAYLQIHGGGHTVAGEHLTLNSTYGGWGALYSAGGPNVWTGDITLQSDAAIGVSSGAELTLSGSIGGGGDLHVVNTGTLVFGGSTANTYVGKTYVDSGTLALDKSVPNGTILGRLYIGDGSGGANADVLVLRSGGQIENERVTIADSGLFDLNGNLEYIGSLSGSGQVNLGSGTLSTGADGTSTTYSGLIQGSGIIRKYGWGTFTLSGNNTYSGDTEIYTGTLQVNGSQTASGVVVDVNGRLGGIGAVGAIESSGTVAPGTSAGMLGAGTTVLGTGSTFELELNGYTFPDYDRLEVKGDIKLADPDLDVSWGFVPAVGDSFLVIANDGNDAVAGSFSGLAEGASVVAGNVTLQITYTGGDGNDVVLAATDVQPLDDLVITSFDVAAGDADLEWEGGVPFYVVEKKTSLTNGTWTAVSSPTRDFAGTVPADTTNGFYRVTGGN